MSQATTQTYKPTTIQKLLGRQYKWWYLLLFYFKSNNTSRLSSLGYLATSLINSFVLILIWSTSSRIGLSDIFTYIIIGSLFFIHFHFSSDLLQDISNGKIVKFMLYPSNLLLIYIIRDLGWNLFITIINVILNLIIIMVLPNLFIFSNMLNFVSFLLFLPIVFTLLIQIEILMGCIAFFIPWSWGLLNFFSEVQGVLSGSRLPLNLFYFTVNISFFASAFTFYHPMQIYLGKYTPLETFYVFLGGIT